MAVRKKRTKSQIPNPNDQAISNDQFSMIDEPVMQESNKGNKMSKWGWAGVAFALLCVYWWKTNTWPVVAMVGTTPIFRHTVNKELYAQGGKAVVDSLVTENLVKNEIRRGGVNISDADVNGKITEIKKEFESDAEFNTALSERNLTLTQLKSQIKIQMGVEKLLSERIEVTASDTATIIKEMGTLLSASSEAERELEAQKIVHDQKLQQEINNWIEEIRNKGKVWWIGRV